MPPSSQPWQVIARHPDYALASWQQIFAVIWRRETTASGAEDLRTKCGEFARANPRGIGLLTIVETGAPLPSSAERKSIADFLAGGSSFIRCSAVIFEGSGFRAAAVRSVVTGLTLMARQAYPHKICDIEEAIRMFCEILPTATGRAVSPAAMRSSLADLRADIDAR
jgi:hypothetical protein